MAPSSDEIREAICERLRAIDGLRSAYPYEPEQLENLPAASMLLRAVDPEEKSTGPRIDLTWGYDLRLYAGLSDWVASQKQIDELIPQILALWRDDPTLQHLIEWWRIRDGGDPVEFNAGEQWMRKTLLVQAFVEDVGAFA
jgi:hypothetical protein